MSQPLTPDSFGSQAENASCLAHHFLVAMPQLDDPNFNGTVTYLWKHDHEGALGVVINRPASLSVAEMLEDLDIEVSAPQSLEHDKVLAGGPVETHKGFILHEAGREWDYTLPINDQLSLSMSKDILQGIASGDGPQRYLIALGCAGWGAGQLEQEIAENVWLTIPADIDLLFSDEHDTMAARVVKLLGINLDQLSTLTGHS